MIPFWAHGHPSSVSCRLDGGHVRACRSPVRLHALADGPHRLRLHARNRLGSVTVTIFWTLPATRTTIVSTPVEVSPPELSPPPDQ